jgi:hypothetical protein
LPNLRADRGAGTMTQASPTDIIIGVDTHKAGTDGSCEIVA